MTERSLVVRQGSLQDIENSLRDATTRISAYLTDLADVVTTQTSGWLEHTPSREVERDYARRLAAGVERLGAALEQVATEVGNHRERAHDIEVENVAIIG